MFALGFYVVSFCVHKKGEMDACVSTESKHTPKHYHGMLLVMQILHIFKELSMK